MVALFVSLGILVLVWVATRVIGRTGAFAFGVLLSIEPWFIGHSYLLHTDAMVATFGCLSILAAVASARQIAGDGERRADRWRRKGLDPTMMVVSSISGALALLTKLNALVLVLPGIALALGWNAAKRCIEAGSGDRLKVLRFHAGVWFGWILGVMFVCVALWPALWFRPRREFDVTRASLLGTSVTGPQFFRGDVVTNVGAWFYPVTFLFRLSPWELAGLIGVAATGVVQIFAFLTGQRDLMKRLPRLPWIVLVATVPYVMAVTIYGRHYDRYALPVFPMVALLVSAWGASIATSLNARWAKRRSFPMLPVVILVSAALLTSYVASEAPFEISYIDPLLGGQRTAQHAIMLGWGEGGSHLGQVIAAREEGHCNQVRVAGITSGLQVPCGSIVALNRLRPGDYFAIARYNSQRGATAQATAGRTGLRYRKVASTTIHGVDYFDLYQVTALQPVLGAETGNKTADVGTQDEGSK